jgi:drug/metabolite transporter (DMT)-like permease
MDATLFALASLACAAGNDLVFRTYGRGPRRSGAYIAVIGLVWMLAFGIAGQALGHDLSPAAIGWGLVAGLCGAAANLLLVEAMARSSAAVCSTIYRLNLVPAAVLAVLLLGEPAGPWTWAGVGLAAAAVGAFAGGAAGGDRTGVLLVALGSLARAGMALAMKAGALAGAAAEPSLMIAGAVWLATGLGWERGRLPDLRTWRFGLGSGVLTAGVVLFLFLALARGCAALVIPVSQLSFAATALLAWPFLGEPLGRRQLAGIGLAVAAIVCLGIIA